MRKRGLRPDCADFVYFLRAYFAYKMGLPFGYSNCSRGIGGRPPKCYQWFDIEHPEVTRPPPPPEQDAAVGQHRAPPPRRRRDARLAADCSPAAAAGRCAAAALRRRSRAPPKPKRPTNFGEYLRDVGDVVHTGAVRVAGNDDNTDFYTVPLTQEALRPGTVYADPYGHVLMLVHRVPEVDGKPGVFLAVDAEPDGSITRKRFWRGNFLFVHEPALGSPGFKHFRPIVRDKNGPLRRLTNAEIAKNPQYGDFSLEQSQMSAEDFYDRMDDVMSPEPLDPVKAMTDAIASLDEQVKTRVTVGGERTKIPGQDRRRRPRCRTAPRSSRPPAPGRIIPRRRAIFRLLIAIDVVRGFPDHVARRAGPLRDPGRQERRRREERNCRACSPPNLPRARFTYTRSDGSPWTLSLKDVIDRVGGFRDGLQPERLRRTALGRARKQRRSLDLQAPRAGGAARQDVADYRSWFRERHWPTHG